MSLDFKTKTTITRLQAAHKITQLLMRNTRTQT